MAPRKLPDIETPHNVIESLPALNAVPSHYNCHSMSDAGTCSDITHDIGTLKLGSRLHQDEAGQDDVPAVARPRPEPSTTRLARLPPLPKGSALSQRYYFLGWHVTSEWLTNLALENNFPNVFAYYTSFDGIRYICWKSGYKYAYPAVGLVENGEHFEGQVSGHGKDMVIDIIMVYVNKRAYAHRRPTELQLERLTHIFGSGPRWFKDGRRPQDFDDYEMWMPIR